jgi:dihydrofolate reductase
MILARAAGHSGESPSTKEPAVPKVRVHNLAMSLDGYVAGPNQSVENPLGIGGEELHEWIFLTRRGRAMIGEDGGDEGPDNDFFARGEENIGAHIMGRNMFGPVRGEWGDEQWRGWWGDNPPYHHQVFVLTHHPRESLEMDGGTTFHFVTDGIDAALERARQAAGTSDIRLGGGAATVRQYMERGLIDELHVAVVPIFLGGGERIFEGTGYLGYEKIERVCSPNVTHVVLGRRA